MRWLLIGNPENRRVTDFAQAVRDEAQAEPAVLPHEALLAHPETLLEQPDEPTFVRIDSVGENTEVSRELLRRGYDRARSLGFSACAPEQVGGHPHFGEVFYPRQEFLGFACYLEELAQVLEERPAWQVLQKPRAILELFDKRLTSERYCREDIPVPEVIRCEATPDALRAAIREAGARRVFVKLSCGSSASGLALYRFLEPGRESVLTTLRRYRGGWYNSLRLQHLLDQPAIDQTLSAILEQGAQVEREIPKLKLDGEHVDCRVLVVDGTPRFTVVRQSQHPITNLHLGGRRGDLAQLKERVGAGVFERALGACARVAKLHDCFHVGVDLMFESGGRGFRILEANAFGDLLPRLERDGRSVYGWQVARLLGKV